MYRIYPACLSVHVTSPRSLLDSVFPQPDHHLPILFSTWVRLFRQQEMISLPAMLQQKGRAWKILTCSRSLQTLSWTSSSMNSMSKLSPMCFQRPRCSQYTHRKFLNPDSAAKTQIPGIRPLRFQRGSYVKASGEVRIDIRM
jgi:hypothetical protein